MSMNLICNHLELWQTPTEITYMCLMESDGRRQELKGKAAIRALRIYMQWVQSTGIRIARTPEEITQMDRQRVQINSHLSEVMVVVKNPPKNLVVQMI